MTHSSLSSLTDAMFSTARMQEVFSARGCVQGMLDFEAALAAAEAKTGVIPMLAAQAIAAHCHAGEIDLDQLGAAAASAGNLAIPLVRQLTERVAQTDTEAAKYVHWGATSQDTIDTGLVLQLRAALDLIEADLARLGDTLADMARRHCDTVVVGRTWLQHALPTTFGLKAAGWLDAVHRHQDRLTALRLRLSVLQFGGATGTLASLGDAGLHVSRALADELNLALPATPWHTQRDRVTEVATTLGMLVGSLGKMARDIALHMQTDVAEVAEPAAAGRGGSSTMPHKRNPVSCAAVLAAATRVPGLVATMLTAMVQEQERALGGWQAEWDTLPEIVMLAAGAVQQMTQTAAGLTVDAQRMRANLDATHGLIMSEAVTLALGASMGRLQAHRLVEAACHRAVEAGSGLREALMQEPGISSRLQPSQIDTLLDPRGYLGQAEAFVDRVLDEHGKRATRDR